MTRKTMAAEPQAHHMPDNCLEVAIAACRQSKHASDKQFARDCLAELRRRIQQREKQLEAA